MIGVWDYTIILTYLGLTSTVVGMTMAINGDLLTAMICLAFSGFCDAFDGRAARSKKDRTDTEKMFGVQLDSLCDAVCFGFFPIVICYQLGVTGKIGVALMTFYAIAAVARLAYFNVLEMERSPEDNSPRFYVGMPVTSIAVIFPTIFFVNYWVPFEFKPLVWELMLLVTGALFIANIKIPKPTLRQILALVIVVIALFLTMTFL